MPARLKPQKRTGRPSLFLSLAPLVVVVVVVFLFSLPAFLIVPADRGLPNANGRWRNKKCHFETCNPYV